MWPGCQIRFLFVVVLKGEVETLWGKLSKREKELNMSKVGARDLSHAVKSMKTALEQSRLDAKTMKDKLASLQVRVHEAYKTCGVEYGKCLWSRPWRACPWRHIKDMGWSMENVREAAHARHVKYVGKCKSACPWRRIKHTG